MKKSFFFGLSFLFLSTFSFAQQYMIKYDVLKKQSHFYKINNDDTSKVKHIEPKKMKRLFLRVENYNPFYWNAKVTAYKNPVDEAVDYGNSFNPISLLANSMGGVMSSIPGLDLPKNRGELTKGEMSESSFNYLSAVENYKRAYDDAQLVSKKIEEIQLAKIQLNELKFSTTLSENEIKTQSAQIIKKTLNSEDLSIARIYEIGKNYSTRLTNAINNSQTEFATIKNLKKSINPNEVYEGKTLQNIGDEIERNNSKILQMNNLVQSGNNNLIEDVAQLASINNEIQNASYIYQYSISDQDDITDLKLELFPKQSNSTDTLVQYFTFSRTKTLRIRNSVGLAFTYFNANNKSYYISPANTIQVGGKDNFTPLLATYIHFYPVKTKGMKLGGTLGFGMPVEGQIKTINFMLGPTLAVGKNEPIIISAGACGSKVNKLINGYKVGDVTNITDPAKLTVPGYGVGGFLSVSFNLSSLNFKN